MKYSKEFLETNARLKTLDKEALNDELNKMTFDELLAHRDYMIREELGEENLIPEERRQEQIKKLQQMTREPSAAEVKPIRIHSYRTAKRIVALAAAIVVMISVFMVAAVASKRDFSILNGIVRFEDGKVYVKFSRNDDAAMTLAELETDLREHGFEDVKIPGFFYENMCMVKELEYRDDSLFGEVAFDLTNNSTDYSIYFYKTNGNKLKRTFVFDGAENAEAITKNDVNIYIFDHGKGKSEIKYFYADDKYSCEIIANVPFDKMIKIASTIK